MPTRRHVGHGVPIIADQSRTTRAVAKAAELAPIIAELREDGITNPLAEAILARDNRFRARVEAVGRVIPGQRCPPSDAPT
jgi:hypothetical protein